MQGATAIFAVTSFFEVLFRVAKGSPDEAAIKEAELAKIIARAAAKTSSLEHYIWSTLPSAKAKSGGKFPVPHFDGKAEADEWIKSDLPDLHKKTTYLMVGFYPNNIASIPGLKPVEFVSISRFELDGVRSTQMLTFCHSLALESGFRCFPRLHPP